MIVQLQVECEFHSLRQWWSWRKMGAFSCLFEFEIRFSCRGLDRWPYLWEILGFTPKRDNYSVKRVLSLLISPTCRKSPWSNTMYTDVGDQLWSYFWVSNKQHYLSLSVYTDVASYHPVDKIEQHGIEPHITPPNTWWRVPPGLFFNVFLQTTSFFKAFLCRGHSFPSGCAVFVWVCGDSTASKGVESYHPPQPQRACPPGRRPPYFWLLSKVWTPVTASRSF